MQAVDFILENWSSRESAQLALKFGLLLLPIALWLWAPAFRRRHARLVVTFAAATGVLFLVVGYIQITWGKYTTTLLAWEDRRFAIEIAGYQLSFALVGAWSGLRRQTEALKGVAFALILAVGITAVGNLLGWGGRLPLVAQLGIWALGLGLALLASVVLGRIAWLRVHLAIAGFFLGYCAIVHLHAWLFEGELTMGHVGPSLWHDVAFPVVVFWILRRH